MAKQPLTEMKVVDRGTGEVLSAMVAQTPNKTEAGIRIYLSLNFRGVTWFQEMHKKNPKFPNITCLEDLENWFIAATGIPKEGLGSMGKIENFQIFNGGVEFIPPVKPGKSAVPSVPTMEIPQVAVETPQVAQIPTSVPQMPQMAVPVPVVKADVVSQDEKNLGNLINLLNKKEHTDETIWGAMVKKVGVPKATELWTKAKETISKAVQAPVPTTAPAAPVIPQAIAPAVPQIQAPAQPQGIDNILGL